MYLTNLLRALESYQSKQIQPVLFVGEDVEQADLLPLRQISNVEIVRSSLFDQERFTVRRALALVWGIDREAVEIFTRNRIDVVFESATFYGRNSPFPAIAWLPDFQHCRLRQHFTLVAYWRRETGFRAQVASGRHIMLSSEDARKDCEHFYRRSIGRTSVVRFAAFIGQDMIEKHPERRIAEYGLPNRFYYLPNQFWEHKNHAAVIEALGILKEGGCDIVVAASGSPLDYRRAHHFERIRQLIKQRGVESNFRILGQIPRLHLISLLRTCTGMINPSFFEGWSTTVEEGRALGVPMLLSSIGTHKEQMGKKAIYFDPSDPNDLALKLGEFHLRSAPPSQPRVVDGSNTRDLQRFASDFIGVVGRARGLELVMEQTKLRA